MATFKGTPQKVIRQALANGAHPDCLVSGREEDACDDCRALLQSALHSVYGHLESTEDVIVEILVDLSEDDQP